MLAAVEREMPVATTLRHELHAVPELGYNENKTIRRVADLLPVTGQPIARTGLLARIGDSSSPAVAIRAELDGLPFTEETGSAFAATNGYMHACGHDVHVAALVAVVRAAHSMSKDLPAPLLGLFQPSEERHPSGALDVIQSSDLLGDVRAVIAAHLHPDLTWGTVGAEAGVVNAAAEAVEITIRGRAGHGAYPHHAKDPVLALAHVVVALHTIVSRQVDPIHSAVVTVGALSAGSSENVIPDSATARATLRALDPADLRLLHDAVQAVVTDIPRAFGCSGIVEFTKAEPPLVNSASLAAAVQQLAVGADLQIARPWRSCGGDDFAHYSRLAPALMQFVGLRNGPGFAYAPLHHPKFMPPDEAIILVARAQVLAYVAASTNSLIESTESAHEPHVE
jgi:amidohydrolase